MSKPQIFSDVVILTERSVGRILRWEFARDVCEILHCVQNDKMETWTTSILLPKLKLADFQSTEILLLLASWCFVSHKIHEIHKIGKSLRPCL